MTTYECFCTIYADYMDYGKQILVDVNKLFQFTLPKPTNKQTLTNIISECIEEFYHFDKRCTFNINYLRVKRDGGWSYIIRLNNDIGDDPLAVNYMPASMM